MAGVLKRTGMMCGLPFQFNICERKYGVLRKLKHIFPNTYQRINSICSPAKVGLVITDFNYQPGS